MLWKTVTSTQALHLSAGEIPSFSTSNALMDPDDSRDSVTWRSTGPKNCSALFPQKCPRSNSCILFHRAHVPATGSTLCSAEDKDTVFNISASSRTRSGDPKVLPGDDEEDGWTDTVSQLSSSTWNSTELEGWESSDLFWIQEIHLDKHISFLLKTGIITLVWLLGLFSSSKKMLLHRQTFFQQHKAVQRYDTAFGQNCVSRRRWQTNDTPQL